MFDRGDRLAIIAHRGGRGAGWPAENTFASFERGLAAGADGVELDVRLCATGEAVVFHDADLKRATSSADRREVSRVPYVELGSMKLFGGAQGAPLLRDVLAMAADRHIGVNVEIKYDKVDRPRLVRNVARELDRQTRADVVVSSFDPRILAQLKARRPRTRIALLTTPERRWSFPFARYGTPKGLFYAVHFEHTQATPSAVQALVHRGVRVGVWTVNDADEALALRDAGASYVITDDPTRLAESVKVSLRTRPAPS